MFAGLKSWFSTNKTEVETVAEGATTVVLASGVVSPALAAALGALGVAFETSGIAFTCFHNSALLVNLATALLGASHPAVVAHLAAISKDVAAVAAVTPVAVAQNGPSTGTTVTTTITSTPVSATSSTASGS